MWDFRREIEGCITVCTSSFQEQNSVETNSSCHRFLELFLCLPSESCHAFLQKKLFLITIARISFYCLRTKKPKWYKGRNNPQDISTKETVQLGDRLEGESHREHRLQAKVLGTNLCQVHNDKQTKRIKFLKTVCTLFIILFNSASYKMHYEYQCGGGESCS